MHTCLSKRHEVSSPSAELVTRNRQSRPLNISLNTSFSFFVGSLSVPVLAAVLFGYLPVCLVWEPQVKRNERSSAEAESLVQWSFPGKHFKHWYLTIAVIAVEPTGKAFFVYSYVKTRLMGQYNGKWPLSLVYVLKPLITAIRAIGRQQFPQLMFRYPRKYRSYFAYKNKQTE